MRYRGAITPPARSADNFPVIRRNRRNARRELQVSATVRFAIRVERVCTNASTSSNVICSTDFVLRCRCLRKLLAVSRSRMQCSFRDAIVNSPILTIFVEYGRQRCFLFLTPRGQRRAESMQRAGPRVEGIVSEIAAVWSTCRPLQPGANISTEEPPQSRHG